MRMSSTYIPRLAGLSGVDPRDISGRVMVNGEPVLYAHAIMRYKGRNWIVSDDQDFIINDLGAPVGAVINGILVPLDKMSDDQHAHFQPKYGYKVIPVSPTTPGDGRLGFGFHISLPHISIPHPHISLPSRQQMLKVGRIAAAATAVYFTAGAAAAALKGAAPLLLAKLAGGGAGAPDAAPADAGAPADTSVPMIAPDTSPVAPGATPPLKPKVNPVFTWGALAAAALLLL